MNKLKIYTVAALTLLGCMPNNKSAVENKTPVEDPPVVNMQSGVGVFHARVNSIEKDDKNPDIACKIELSYKLYGEEKEISFSYPLNKNIEVGKDYSTTIRHINGVATNIEIGQEIKRFGNIRHNRVPPGADKKFGEKFLVDSAALKETGSRSK